jgi:hypothetical protein
VCFIDELSGSIELDGQRRHTGEIERVVDAFNEDEQMRIDGEDGIAPALGCGMPVRGRAASPGHVDARLVAEIDANDKRIALVALDHALPVGQPTGFWIAAVVPECVAVVAAAPLRITVVVVEDHHDVGRSERRNHLIEDGERVLALHACVRRDGVVANDGIRLIHLIGPGEANRIEAEALDLGNDGLERLELQAGDDVVGRVRSIPVHRSEADATALAIHNGGAGDV